MAPKELKPGDACPNCTGELKPAPVPTAEQSARLADKENPIVLERTFDTASPEQREKLGALHRCATCGYEARFKAEDAAEGDEAAAGGGGSRKRK